MVFAEGFVGGLEHGVDAVPFVFGVVQVELLGAGGRFSPPATRRRICPLTALTGSDVLASDASES